MPTAAEVALQRKYADMRAKKQQQVASHVNLQETLRLLRDHGMQMEATKAASLQPVKRQEGPVKGTYEQFISRGTKNASASKLRQTLVAVVVKSKHLQPLQNGKQVLPAAQQAKTATMQALPAVKQGPKVMWLASS